MSFATARRDIEKRMQDNFATLPVSYDNVNFTPPSSGNSSGWVAFHILEEDSNRINIGLSGTHRMIGSIIAAIYVPLNTGTNSIRGYADDIAAIFRDKQFSGITCREAKVTNQGEIKEWYQLDVLIPFYWDGTY